MAKYKRGDQFLLRIGEPPHKDGDFYKIEGAEVSISEAVLDKLPRYDVTASYSCLKPYRPWTVLLDEPDDMTQSEQCRLSRIKRIDPILRECILEHIQKTENEIMELEKQKDYLIDFLNGELKHNDNG